jgi:hypothetical protein
MQPNSSTADVGAESGGIVIEMMIKIEKINNNQAHLRLYPQKVDELHLKAILPDDYHEIYQLLKYHDA